MKIRDDRDRTFTFVTPPRRIVSLVPSDTYSLAWLGGRDRLVGRTRFCVEPADVADVEEVGGTKDPDVDRIVALAPDVVVANQEENTRDAILKLEAAGLPVLVTFPRTFGQGIGQLARLALLLGGGAQVRDRTLEAYRAQKEAEAARGSRTPIRAFLPIWMDPLMTANADTFVSDMLELVGATNVFADRIRRYPLAADVGTKEPLPPERVGDKDTRYPRVTLDEVRERAPEIVLLPDEPHPFGEADAKVFRELDIPAARRGAVVFCNGKDLMWPGARSLEGLGRLRAAIDAARA